MNEKDSIFSTEPIVDVMGLALQNGDDELWRRRCEFNRKYHEICHRYDSSRTQDSNGWVEWTPKQLKRMRKQTAKYRRRFLGEYF